MIIWGSRGREKVKSSGQFYCPQCEAFRSYKFKEVGKYFTLYFIPLFETKKLAEYVECEYCHQTFKPEVLNYRPPSQKDRIVEVIEKIRDELYSGMPLHMERQRLINMGMTEETANLLVAGAVGRETSSCPKCGFTYARAVSTCPNCGSMNV